MKKIIILGIIGMLLLIQFVNADGILLTNRSDIIEDSEVYNLNENEVLNYDYFYLTWLGIDDIEPLNNQELRYYLAINISKLNNTVEINNAGLFGRITAYAEPDTWGIYESSIFNEHNLTWNNQPCSTQIGIIGGSCNSTYASTSYFNSQSVLYFNITFMLSNLIRNNNTVLYVVFQAQTDTENGINGMSGKEYVESVYEAGQECEPSYFCETPYLLVDYSETTSSTTTTSTTTSSTTTSSTTTTLIQTPYCTASYTPNNYSIIYGSYSSGNINSLKYLDNDTLKIFEQNETDDLQLGVIVTFKNIPPMNYENAKYYLEIDGTSFLQDNDSVMFIIYDYSIDDFTTFQNSEFLTDGSNETKKIINSQFDNPQNFIYNGEMKIAYRDLIIVNGTQNQVDIDYMTMCIYLKEIPPLHLNESSLLKYDECPIILSDMRWLYIFCIILCIFFILMGYLFKHGLIGGFASLGLLMLSLYLYSCDFITASIFTTISVLSMYFFCIRGWRGELK